MTFDSLNTITIHTLNGREVNAKVLEVTGHSVDPVSEGDVGGDDSGGNLVVQVSGSPSVAQQAALKRFRETGEGHALTIISAVLNMEAFNGHIPCGPYHIAYTWG
jgi:hypothetical protein